MTPHSSSSHHSNTATTIAVPRSRSRATRALPVLRVLGCPGTGSPLRQLILEERRQAVGGVSELRIPLPHAGDMDKLLLATSEKFDRSIAMLSLQLSSDQHCASPEIFAGNQNPSLLVLSNSLLLRLELLLPSLAALPPTGFLALPSPRQQPPFRTRDSSQDRLLAVSSGFRILLAQINIADLAEFRLRRALHLGVARVRTRGICAPSWASAGSTLLQTPDTDGKALRSPGMVDRCYGPGLR
jgi:hypothetical protein